MSSISRRRMLASAGAVVLAAPSISTSAARAAGMRPGPPTARIAPVTDTYWGVPLVDPYRWMEVQPRSPEFEAWLKGQGDFARKVLDALPARVDMARRLERYTADMDLFAKAQPAGGRLFVAKRPAGAETIQLFVREADGRERLLYDPGAGVAPGAPPTAMDDWSVSPNGRHVALSTSVGGSETGITSVLDVDAGSPVEITRIRARVTGWTADGQGLFYYRLRADAVPGAPDYGVGGACWLHRIGSDPKSDLQVFKSGEGPDFEAMEDDMPAVAGAVGSDWLVGTHVLNGARPAEVFLVRAADLLAGRPTWRKVAGRADDVRDIALVGDQVYLLACGRKSNGEVVRIDARTDTFASGKVVMSADQAVIDQMAAARDGVYVHDRLAGMGGLRRIDPAGAVVRLPPPRSGNIWTVAATPDADGAWFQMDDLAWPGSSYHVAGGDSLAAREVRLVNPPPFDVAGFTTTRVEAPARDGERVPLEILHRADIKRDGRNPLLLYAYGSYGVILDPGFQASTLAFLEAGGIIVYAHVRGGGEKGEAWHQAGFKAAKPNTWRDAIDSAEFLIRSGWTSKSHLALWGTSAGGIMVGGAIAERPDLFAAAVGEVGAFNMVRFELTANGPGNDAEFGTVKKADEFHALLAMDAYHNVKDGVRYPATLLLTGANDPRVEPWQVGKYAARLQAASANPEGALLRVDYAAGHHATSHAVAVAKMADLYGFVLAHTR